MSSDRKSPRRLFSAALRMLRKFARRASPHPSMVRPFRRRDLRPVPPDWRRDGPDFVGIATSKAGTSWWYSLILKHPQVAANRLGRKELSYFQHFGYRRLSEEDVAIYREAFAKPDGKICGEWSPGYLTYPLAIEHLKEAAPNAKLLVILRNPIDRAVSHLNQLAHARAKMIGVHGTRGYIFRVFSLFPQALGASPSATSLRRLLATFPRSQVLILQYEKCKQSPAQELAATYRFLRIDDSFVPEGLTDTVNRKRYIVNAPDQTERERLADYFRSDVAAIKDILPEIDLSLWSEFENLA